MKIFITTRSGLKNEEKNKNENIQNIFNLKDIIFLNIFVKCIFWHI